MKRWTVTVGLASTVLALGACSKPEEAAPPSTTVAPTTTTATTVVTAPPTTTPPTEPPKPVVTAVPVVMPIDRQETTVPPTTTEPPPPPDSPVPQTGGGGGGSQIDTTPLVAGWIQIPKIGVNYTTYRPSDLYSETALNRAIDSGPTYWLNPTNPGELGNLLVAGHRVSHGAFFRNIDQLVAGDEIIAAGVDGVPHTYLVSEVFVTGPNDLSIADPREGATITLFACHPPGSIRQRIVVYANLKV